MVEIPERFESAINTITQEELRTRGITRQQFRERVEKRIINDQKNSPTIGAEAPDFELEILDAKGQRTGEHQKLSSYRGTPVGLVFGSYT